MPTVREASFDLFRAHGMTTMFGNPGSTELPMLADFPSDFRYVLGLQEAVVVGMADGYAQASGQTSIANLHTAPGVGNAMGAIFNAQANHSPLLVTAGQQVRAQITLQANLTNRDAIRMPAPAGQVVLRAGPRRGRAAGAGPRRPPRLAAAARARSSSRCRWTTGTPRSTRPTPRHAIARQVDGRAVADPEAVARARRAPRRAPPTRSSSPAPTSTRAAAGTPPSRLAERQRLPVWATPGDRAAAGSASPRATPTSAACCRRRSARSARRSRATT